EDEQQDHEKQIQNKNNSHTQPQQTLARRQVQLPAVMSSDEPRHRPQYQRQQHDEQRDYQHRKKKLSTLERADRLPDKEWKRQDHLHLSILIRLEDQF